MSWAKILQAEPEVQAVKAPQAPPEAKSVAVVDTNAIIAGIQLHTLAELLITVPEVLAELRDARSRQALDALPCSLHVREPSEESLRAGTVCALLLCSYKQALGQLLQGVIGLKLNVLLGSSHMLCTNCDNALWYLRWTGQA